MRTVGAIRAVGLRVQKAVVVGEAWGRADLVVADGEEGGLVEAAGGAEASDVSSRQLLGYGAETQVGGKNAKSS